jgi:hypothetical protein
VGQEVIEPTPIRLAVGIDERHQRLAVGSPPVVAGRCRPAPNSPADERGADRRSATALEDDRISGGIVDDDDRGVGAPVRRRIRRDCGDGGGQASGIVADRDDDGDKGRGCRRRRSGMGQAGVEEAPGEALGRRRVGYRFPGGEPIDELPPCTGELEQPDRRSTEQHRLARDPPGSGVERDAEPVGQQSWTGARRDRLRSRGIHGRQRSISATGRAPARRDGCPNRGGRRPSGSDRRCIARWRSFRRRRGRHRR